MGQGCTVDFDRGGTYLFGVLPSDEEHDYPLVGFMENNKWDYDFVVANSHQWARIKELLTLAVENTNAETLEAVDVAIQAVRE